MKTVILLRHGQSLWNLENRFTGWTDVELSEKGREEARDAGEKILKAGLKPQYYFTSYLKRAIHTLNIVAATIDRDWVPVIKDWHLNERHYGALQGLDKAETADKAMNRCTSGAAVMTWLPRSSPLTTRITLATTLVTKIRLMMTCLSPSRLKIPSKECGHVGMK